MRRTLPLLAAGTIVAAGIVIAGPLAPPAGPVASSYKTLTEVEPRIAANAVNTPGDADSMLKITSNGSYYLTADIASIPGKSGLEIAADDVTVDLNGYRIGGYPGALHGIKVTGTNRRNVVVKNGSVWTMGGNGIDLRCDQGVTQGCRILDVSIRDCGGTGLVAGDAAVIDRVDVSGNGATGLTTGISPVVTRCVATHNVGDGLDIGPSGTVSDCTAAGNGGTGVAIDNSGAVRGCTAYGNNGHGFTGYNGVIVGCLAKSNNDGFHLASSVTIRDCTAADNARHGIWVSSDCLVTGNTCENNGSGVGCAGICVAAPDNRVEGNNCFESFYGIFASWAGNLFARNTCSANTINFELVAGNRALVVSAASAGAITGDSGGTSLGSSDPNANYSF